MPAKSKAQQHLMAAAAHNADFPMARKVRESMSMGQLGDFAATPTKGLPKRVTQSKSSAGHPHRNLGKYLHKAKGR